MGQWYQELFSNYARKYDQECFTQGTIQEVDFIEQVMGHKKGLQILDVGCGTGRHAIELAKKGHSLTGIDLSRAQLTRAAEKAAAAEVQVDFIEANACSFELERQFDLAIMICEGAFSLLETDRMNYAVLERIFCHLKLGGRLIFTALNALYPLHHSVEKFINSNCGNVSTKENSFDLQTFREVSVIEFEDDDNNKRSLVCNERYFVPTELSYVLGQIGYQEIEIYGCQTGAFERGRPLTVDDYELLVMAVKP
jgi:SAM-dependent methyltransferase